MKARIIFDCSAGYKKNVEEMAKAREMTITSFLRYLIEKQKEADIKTDRYRIDV